MDIALASLILVLIGVIFYREIKSDKEVDLFMDFIPALIVILSGIFNFKSNDFKFQAISDWIYIVSMVVTIPYVVYFLVKYFKNKKSAKDEKDKLEGDN